jgi:hypothetical protein
MRLDAMTYPLDPGFKRHGPSEAAAEAIAPRAATLCDQVLDLLKRQPMTADECAAAMKKSVLSVRPRLSQLLARNLIEDTGRTRHNISGVSATVWKAVELR